MSANQLRNLPGYEALTRDFGDRLREAVPLAPLTTWGIGGPAEALVRPDTVTELSRLLLFVREHSLPLFILGGGSNVLFADQGFPGLVIKLGRDFGAVAPFGVSQLSAGAAAASAGVLGLAAHRGLSGLEDLAGVPGTIGGAMRMNAGTFGRGVAAVVEKAYCLDDEGHYRTLTEADLVFEYRRLILPPEPWVILGVDFRLAPDSREAVEARVRESLGRRAQNQPRGGRNSGCVFKNPPNDYAGRLIDQAGLKGLTRGGAEVSPDHANFIVNKGGARAADVLELMKIIVETVEKAGGPRLEPEVRLAGFVKEELF